ncbi:hypothetical protein DVB69_02140 [Sporosarcina sp. BI001-red]|uniref:UPF0223 family protein n=1 Tax=Sporosarcina sp. BI001-red TaxID=2282866 RepID=UPI000E22D528|nr:UPF0223 family protein [Sporosarcina sp. BI001-red]REB09629.1 hypothetical protein DVB69_02140 [Sporosarcina sp. BI001-red]
MEYSYPLRADWSTEEIMTVTGFFTCIEKAFEQGIGRDELLNAYNAFKKVVPSMAEEKTLFKEFKDASSYECYKVVKRAKEGVSGDVIKG